MSPPVIVSWGGGVNSTAMVLAMHARQMRPDAILFADTGGEKPTTYAHLAQFSAWCVAHGLPAIVTVANDGMYRTLERNCLEKAMLPSIAYGLKSCSDKYKRRPQEKWAKSWAPALACWAAGGKVRKVIGYDAGESHRVKIPEDDAYSYWYPLIEWDMGREECIATIRQAGLTVPSKSACFFCPSSKKREVLALAKDHPDLFERAVQMERAAAANLTSVRGLGRTYSWETLVRADDAQGKLFPEAPSLPCMCFDGDDD